MHICYVSSRLLRLTGADMRYRYTTGYVLSLMWQVLCQISSPAGRYSRPLALVCGTIAQCMTRSLSRAKWDLTQCSVHAKRGLSKCVFLMTASRTAVFALISPTPEPCPTDSGIT